jgi:hypothetical protein
MAGRWVSSCFFPFLATAATAPDALPADEAVKKPKDDPGQASRATHATDKEVFVLTRALVLLATISLGGCGTTLVGKVSARALTPGTKPATFALLKTSEAPSLQEQNVNECLLRHFEAAGLRLVDPENDPAAVVAFAFSNGGTPIGYRSRDTSHWQDKSQITTTGVWERTFTVYVFDATSTEKLKILWEGEVISSGSNPSPIPIVYGFLDQIFRRYPGNATNESFTISPLPEVCQAPQRRTR